MLPCRRIRGVPLQLFAVPISSFNLCRQLVLEADCCSLKLFDDGVSCLELLRKLFGRRFLLACQLSSVCLLQARQLGLLCGTWQATIASRSYIKQRLALNHHMWFYIHVSLVHHAGQLNPMRLLIMLLVVQQVITTLPNRGNCDLNTASVRLAESTIFLGCCPGIWSDM